MSIEEFLLTRIAEDEAAARKLAETDRRPVLSLASTVNHPERLLLECEAKRRVVELHRDWPVLTETPPTVERVDSADPDTFALRASQQIMWQTEREYRQKFGVEPPTGPMLRAIAAIYADHPDYDESWAV